MPFVKVDIKKEIEEQCNNDPEFKEKWEKSRQEYKVLGEIVKLRKKMGLTQQELGKYIGVKQQVISRIEKRENSPTLNTLCNILDALGYELEIVSKVSKAQ